ncbi:MAG: PIN domain-containing protein [Candidatus Scalindua sp. AMX11]|nr:MAG: PIN domain-containing protein [Candidatus Scalindua sp.]NOG85557.1 PIN domain-containing protein [Planctomycetota bacterium]RZV90194.1 MAG: PIN domain-containing protein [Candidatus Scalindua sp. SCAELEC01]TDE64978.1 MAG: PIN domain-containing protein [Candidatus Scalindua sp. AMX11]GJQ59587.1 MAG: twitching motility protein PilT [Candidatus Scalindua sp.]
MQVLVDTSIWVDYFRGGIKSSELSALIDENLIVTNDIILTELIPSLRVKRQNKVVRLLNEIMKFPLKINWEEIIQFQIKCLKSGMSGVGIPYLIIAQNSKQNNCRIYSLDSHFRMLQKIIGIKNYGY